MTYLVAVAIPVVAGLFALLGSFAGSRLAQKAEHDKWLREKRSTAFAEFLKALSDAHSAAHEALNMPNVDELQKSIGVTEAYLPVENHGRIVSLFLPPERRSTFRSHLREIWALHGQASLGDSRHLKIAERQNDIQRLFEDLL